MQTIDQAIGVGNNEIHSDGYMFRECPDGCWVENEIGEGMVINDEQQKRIMSYSIMNSCTAGKALEHFWDKWF